jgi:hypothetical protein
VQKALARGITASCVLAALAAAGPALGGDPVSTQYSAAFEYGGTISFVRDKGNHNQNVHDIQIEAISANCGGRAGELNYSILGNTKILDDRSFAVRSEDGDGGKAIVRGQFTRRFKTTKGTARLHGKFQLAGTEGPTKCETGKQKFKATISG